MDMTRIDMKNLIASITGKAMNSERKYSKVDIVKRLGIPRERLRDWISRCFVFARDREAAGQRTKAIFSRLDVYGIALFEYLVKERFFSLEKATKFTELWLQTMSGVASRTRSPSIEQRKKSDPSNVLIFIYMSTPAGKELICEPVGIYGRKESEEGFHFFKALGEILKNKLKDIPWDDVCVVNIGKIKRQVDAQLS
jgi:hypothetical protein